MTKQGSFVAMAVGLALSLSACDQKGDVDKQIQDLKEAEQKAPQEAQELTKQLDQAKGDVVRLEEKVALAKQGVTDDVVKEKKELQQAIGQEANDVKNEVNEAQHKASAHNADVDKAQQELQKVQSAQHVQAKVTTETQVVPSQNQVQVERVPQQAPIEQNKLVERKTDQAAPTTTTRSTTTGAASTGAANTGALQR